MFNLKTIALVALVGTLCAGGNASAMPVTWDYNTAPLVSVIGTGSQPLNFSSGGFVTSANGYTGMTGLFGSLTLTASPIGKSSLTGLGVCDGGLSESNLGCAQIDRIGSNDVLRIALPDAGWAVSSVVVGLVDASADSFLLFGSNTALPTNVSDFSLLSSGAIAALGSSLGGGFWNIPIGASGGFDYLFFTTAADNTGYSLTSLTASPVPEPGTLILLSTGLVAFGASRRAKKRV